MKKKVDGKFWKPIIRPTSGAVETEKSLVNKELRKIDSGSLQFIEAQKELVEQCCLALITFRSSRSKAEKKRC